MIDPRISKLAQILVQYSTEVKKGDTVLIRGSVAAAPLTREIYREVLKAGAHPTTHILGEGLQEIFFQEAQDHQIDYADPMAEHYMSNFDCFLDTYADYNSRKLSGVPPEKLARVQQARKEVTNIFWTRLSSGDLRWCLAPLPTQSMAQDADMGFPDYYEYLLGTLKLNAEDPVAEWRQLEKRQDAICSFLAGVKEMHFVGEQTDLTMNFEGRKWINCCGKLNLPDGEVFSAPIEDSVNGTIRFSLPGIYQGTEIEDIRLTFKDGQVIEGKASKGEELLGHILEVPGARVLGEVAIGTNDQADRFIKNMLVDEKMGGYVHMALGHAPLEVGKNKSAIHWDILKDMQVPGSYIEADGEKIYVDGEFTMVL